MNGTGMSVQARVGNRFKVAPAKLWIWLAGVWCATLVLLGICGCRSEGWYTTAETMWWRVRGALLEVPPGNAQREILCRTPAHQPDVPVFAGQPRGRDGPPARSDTDVESSLPVPRALPTGSPISVTEPLDLNGIIVVALEQHPALIAARWDVEAARGRLIQAGLYPNPEISYEAQNVGERGPAGNGGLHGVGVEQEFVTGGKLRLAQQVARYDLAATDWQLVARRYELITRIRLAWVEYAAAQEQIRILEQFVRLVGEDENGLVPLARRLEKVAGMRWELLRAELEWRNAQAQLVAARRHAEAAKLALLASAALPPDTPLSPPPPLSLDTPQYEWERARDALVERSAELRQVQMAVLRSQQEWQRVAAQNIPNFRVRALPLYSASEDNAQFQIEVRVPLPIFDRQQGNLLAVQAELARNIRWVDKTRLDLTRQLAEAYGRYAGARQQAQTYAEHVLPRAEESLKVMRTAFQRAKPEELRSAFLGLLEAHRAWLDAQLGYLQARRELWLAVYEIAGLLQQDRLESVPP